MSNKGYRTADDAKHTVLNEGRLGSVPASLDAENLTYLYALNVQLYDWLMSVTEAIARIEKRTLEARIDQLEGSMNPHDIPPRAEPPAPSLHDLVQDARGTLASAVNALDDLRDAADNDDPKDVLSRLISTVEDVTRDFDKLTAVERSAE